MRTQAKATLLSGVGAVLGGWLGNTFARTERKNGEGTVAGITVFGSAVGAVVGAAIGAHAPPDGPRIQMQLEPATDITPVAWTNSPILVVDPTVTTQTVALSPGAKVIVYLPATFTWVSVDGSPIADTVSPYEFTFLGSVTHTFVWVDALHAQHTSTFNFVLNQQPQSETA